MQHVFTIVVDIGALCGLGIALLVAAEWTASQVQVRLAYHRYRREVEQQSEHRSLFDDTAGQRDG